MDAAPRPSESSEPPLEPPLVLALRTTVLLFAAFLTLGVVLQLAHPPLGMWLTQLLVFLGLPAVMVLRSGRSPLDYPGLAWRGFGPPLVGLLLGVLNFFAIVAPLQLLLFKVVPESLRRQFDGAQIFEDLATWELGVVLGAVVLAAPLCEEYFFRGVLQQGLQRTQLHRRGVAVVVAAAIFSAFHLDPVGFVGRLELGVLFGLLYLRTGSIWPSIGAHLANNGVSAALFLAGRASGSGAGAEAEAALPEATGVAAIAGLGGLLMVGLLWAIHTSPGLLPARALGPEAPARPIPSAARAWGTWGLAVILGLALLFTTQWRAARLQAYDLTHPLPPKAERSLEEVERFEALGELRRQAREGDLPLERYFEARRRAARKGTALDSDAP